jgi:hypothetical protein
MQSHLDREGQLYDPDWNRGVLWLFSGHNSAHWFPRPGPRRLTDRARSTDYTSAFTAPLNMAMSWDRSLMWAQPYANGVEHKAKGMQLPGQFIYAI